VTDVVEALARQRVVPVIRARDSDDAVATGMACAAAGMTVIELTYTTPDVESAVASLAAKGLLVGVGTVRTGEQVRRSAQVGARFVVSFANPPDLVPAARDAGMSAIPGALTPSEVEACVRAGADAVKIFPARGVSTEYVGDLLAVLPGLRVIVTGGIQVTYESLGPWLDAGVLAVGLGSDIGTAARTGPAAVERQARAALALARSRAQTG
jgi:2-dehydro-3-deoxyphosphogluconate aldolase/(4S)-4-hydroxy-2-oxoglutarate aldolase